MMFVCYLFDRAPSPGTPLIGGFRTPVLYRARMYPNIGALSFSTAYGPHQRTLEIMAEFAGSDRKERNAGTNRAPVFAAVKGERNDDNGFSLGDRKVAAACESRF